VAGIVGASAAADGSAAASRLPRVLATLAHRRIVRPHRLTRGLTQVVERVVRERSATSPLAAYTVTCLDALARAGCVATTFFVDIAPELPADDDDDSDAASGPHPRVVAELRAAFARAQAGAPAS